MKPQEIRENESEIRLPLNKIITVSPKNLKPLKHKEISGFRYISVSAYFCLIAPCFLITNNKLLTNLILLHFLFKPFIRHMGIGIVRHICLALRMTHYLFPCDLVHVAHS